MAVIKSPVPRIRAPFLPNAAGLFPHSGPGIQRGYDLIRPFQGCFCRYLGGRGRHHAERNSQRCLLWRTGYTPGNYYVPQGHQSSISPASGNVDGRLQLGQIVGERIKPTPNRICSPFYPRPYGGLVMEGDSSLYTAGGFGYFSETKESRKDLGSPTACLS